MQPQPQAQPQGKHAFTSDLTGQEFWLVVDKGYTPLGLVLGNCVYSMGSVRALFAGFKGAQGGEVAQYSRLMYDARELAIGRLQGEADRLGADGVIGVDLVIEYIHGGEWMEVTAVGTAVKYTGITNPSGRSQAQVVMDVSGGKSAAGLTPAGDD
jgi:uncharacterized protein YbjQ (UPF0145 family)